jgi:uncharacterized protein (TIRG00374 family)
MITDTALGGAFASRGGWTWRSLALTAGVLGLLVWTLTAVADLPSVLRVSGAIWSRPDLLGLFMVSYSSAFALRAVAWRLLLPTTSGLGVARLFGFLQASLLANHVFPIKVGEAVRVLLLVRAGIGAGNAAASTVVARLLDLGCLCGLAIAWMLLATGAASHLPLGLAAPLVVLGVGLAIVGAIATRRLSRLWARSPASLARLGRELEGALQAIPGRRVVFALVATLPSWLLEALALWTVANAAGAPISFALAVGAISFTIALQGLQVTPGGIGLYEASLTAALTVQGMDPGTALALAVAAHALKFAYAFGVGLVCLQLEALRGVVTLRRAWPSTNWLDLALVVAALAVVVTLLAEPAGLPIDGVGLVLGVLAALPVVVLGRCHHLPRTLLPLVCLPPALVVLSFGHVQPLAAFVALPIGGVALFLGLAGGPTLIWAVVLTQVILAGAVHPSEVALSGTLASLGVVLARQWWLSHHPRAFSAPLPADGLLCVVIPVHNEAAAVGEVVARVPRQALARRGLRTWIVVVDDGSTDDSAAAAGADEVVRHATRQGLGAALRSGLGIARLRGASAAVYLDGDGEYDAAEMLRLVEPVQNGEADYVLGARFPAALGVMRPARLLGNRAFTLRLMVLSGRRLCDGQTGYRAFSARALAAAEIIHDYNYAQVLTLDLLRKGMRLVEVPIGYRTRQGGSSFIHYHEYARRVLPAIARELLLP